VIIRNIPVEIVAHNFKLFSLTILSLHLDHLGVMIDTFFNNTSQ
jgi:hypothetical protein